MPGKRPIIGITACTKEIEERDYHATSDKYLRPIIDLVDASPLLIPAIGHAADIPAILDAVDGLLITGSISNIEPARYGHERHPNNTCADPGRDDVTLKLIPAAVEAGIPLLAICRGFQEMNVAYGGTLYQEIHEIEGKMDHRQPQDYKTVEDKYAKSHHVTVTPGGILAQLTGQECFMVNSLHHQGVQELADSLHIEATADDGIIEAISVKGAKKLAFGVQWHPEWHFEEDEISQALFGALKNSVNY